VQQLPEDPEGGVGECGSHRRELSLIGLGAVATLLIDYFERHRLPFRPRRPSAHYFGRRLMTDLLQAAALEQCR